MRAVEGGPQEVDVLYWLSGAAMEFVAQAGMGRSLSSISPEGSSAHPLAEAIKNLAYVNEVPQMLCVCLLDVMLMILTPAGLQLLN